MPQQRRMARFGWFIGLWLAGVLAVGAIGLVIKLMLAN